MNPSLESRVTALEKEVLFLKERDTQCRLKYKQIKLEIKVMKLKATATAKSQQETLDKLLQSAENQPDYRYSEYYEEDEDDAKFYGDVDGQTSKTENENEITNQGLDNSTANGSTLISKSSFYNNEQEQEDTKYSDYAMLNEDDGEFTNYQNSGEKSELTELDSTKTADETATQTHRKKKKKGRRTKSNESEVASKSKGNGIEATPNEFALVGETSTPKRPKKSENHSSVLKPHILSPSGDELTDQAVMLNEDDGEFTNYQNSGELNNSSELKGLVSTKTADETATRKNKNKRRRTGSNESEEASNSKGNELEALPNEFDLADETSTPKCPKKSEDHSSVLTPHILSLSPGSDGLTDQAVLECTNCWEVFPTKPKLDLHIRTAHPPKFTCLKCDMTFENKDDFYKHEKAHEQQQCKTCNKFFGHPSTLKRHERIHEKTDDPKSRQTSKEIFSCLICPEKFNDAMKMKEHLMSHNDGRSYECLTCAKKYQRKEALFLHCIQMDHVSSSA